ncbi:AMP-binding protein [Mycolicibacterium monacense]|uniref:Long-chain-fatty-acid--CoA ligase FadD13 n=2 Tax=Mycobacteriaceae TaxID=1762 RepID=A0AAD1IVA1_MYCMB|nr:AMP-binding protein [Mycolicibacterium monacense]MDA4102559.1 AMP-dependent synthetase [Mycolicibacterium monacense DSM 44395]ORB16914.1 AMP-dependent synthetase [Mycolicibacterium monacense DSM 44395]QHP86613.1 AMP-dependent synthetase [Mycolicibacterium monacense DSM 44395]BBZ60335.1 AMP-dependent synthetase [Mycolicibacterium monacense]
MLLHDLVTSAAAADPDRPAVIGPDGAATSFAQFDRQIRSVAGWVATHSEPGDRIAVIADNSTAYARLYYAVPRAGRVLTLVNQRLRADEQYTQLALTEPTVVIGDQTYVDALTELRSQVPSVRHVIAAGSPELTAEPGEPGVDVACAPEDPAWLLFTSGSTGTPKGVVHSHRSILAAVQGSVIGRAVPRGGVYLLPFPMCHIAGYNMLVQHAVAATVVLAAQFRADAIARTINDCAVTACSLAPTMLHALLDHLRATGATLPTLRSIAYGSAAIPAELLRTALERLDVDFHQGYGMTETGGNVTFLGPGDHRRGLAGHPAILAGAGRPHPHVEVRIGDDGEILVRGPQVATSYWRGRSAVDGEGWLATGDIGRIDADGNLYVVDRRRDIVVTGGENVSSREVEDVLTDHPEVESAAVVGVPDEYWGEAVCAVVVAAEGRHPTESALVEHVRARLTGFKRPRHVLFVDALPLTTNGKIDKNRVRRLARSALT